MSLCCDPSKPSSGVSVPSVMVGSGVSSSGRLLSAVVDGPVMSCRSDSSPSCVPTLATSDGVAVAENSLSVADGMS